MPRRESIALGFTWSLHAVRCGMLWLCVIGVPATTGLSAEEQSRKSSFLIYAGEQDVPEVIRFDDSRSYSANTRGILVQSTHAGESYQLYPSENDSELASQRLESVSRGMTGNIAPMGLTASLRFSLDQIRARPVVRGRGFVTPIEGERDLDGRITIRLEQAAGDPDYPAVVVEVLRKGDVLFQVPMREGQSEAAWDDLAVSSALQSGLPPGDYVLRTVGTSSSVSFAVEENEIRDWVLALPKELEHALGDATDPLYLQISAEHLLGQVDENDNPSPYRVDALDLLERADAARLTPYLLRLKDRIRRSLSPDYDPEQSLPDLSPTGIPRIDEARQQIALGNWQEAAGCLDKIPENVTLREEGLTSLYEAVVLAEAGAGQEKQSRTLFESAIRILKDANPEDSFRAHNNYAGFLLSRAQDSLYNRALEFATGNRQSIVDTLGLWHDAVNHYGCAREAAAELDNSEYHATILVNLAMAHNLLADVIRILDESQSENKTFKFLEESARREAVRIATETISEAGDHVPFSVRAAAQDILAHAAFRRGNWEDCRSHAQKARELHLAAGVLPGVEGTYRLLGLVTLQQAAPDDVAARAEALRLLTISHMVAEFLRDRMPMDQIGVTRAGFFARRVYANEKIVELLVKEGRHIDALQCVELAKARSLQDFLIAESLGHHCRERFGRSVDELLSAWPREMAALEYFFTSDRVFLFAIDGLGEVEAQTLRDAAGELLSPVALVQQVMRFRTEMYGAKLKLRQQWPLPDNEWQEDLNELFARLIPESVLNDLRQSKTVLVVPHHVLHYLPFAALVTELDETNVGRSKIASPRFLIDEPFAICYIPSLTSWDFGRQFECKPMTCVSGAGIADFSFSWQYKDLKNVPIEIDNLKSVLGARVRSLFRDSEVTKQRVCEMLRQRGMVLMATHGKNEADNPLTSSLIVYPAEKGNYKLTAQELFHAELGADLVVLSACETALADRTPLPGDDLFGLERALLHSGCRTVVSGLWNVDDMMAPVLMKDFMERLAEGQAAPAALAVAQRTFLDRERKTKARFWVHPHFWAVYRVVGDDRTRLAR